VLESATNNIYFYEFRACFFIFCLCRISGTIIERKVTERYKIVKTSACGAICITNRNSHCNSDYGNSGLKAYFSRQSYCIVLVAVVTTNRYESAQFTDINSIRYGEWRIRAHMSQKLQLKSLICVKTNESAQNKEKEYLKSAFFWVITQRLEIISYRRFGTTYHSHFQR
jgi:hypothetical protein